MTPDPELKAIYDQLVAHSQETEPNLVVDWPPKEGWLKEAYEAAISGKIGFRMRVKADDDPEAG